MAFQLVHSEKLNQSYVGPAEECIWSFKVNLPDQMGARWQANQMVDAHIEELGKQGATLLEFYLYEDTSPTWSTNYKVVVVAATPEPVAGKIALAPLVWMLIITAVLFIIQLVVQPLIERIFESHDYEPSDGDGGDGDGDGDGAKLNWPMIAAAGGLVALLVAVAVKRR